MLKALILWVTGGTIYALIETLSRGYTHWTMFMLGGVCFLLIGGINELLPWKWSITTQSLIGAVLITAAELITGCILNLWLGLDVWDYAAKPYNLLGQICAENCLYWLILSPVGIVLDDFIRYRLFGEKRPKYYL